MKLIEWVECFACGKRFRLDIISGGKELPNCPKCGEGRSRSRRSSNSRPRRR